mmetsp:Transcript_36168/g.87296  ORF Transcript_36168/g.87296 Transcript_36168/m.87296 type:complete len:288 (+) Transcript_36168:1978-2841(+)
MMVMGRGGMRGRPHGHDGLSVRAHGNGYADGAVALGRADGDDAARRNRHGSGHGDPGHAGRLSVLARLGKLLEVFLGVGANLHDGPGLDERRNLLPTLAVLLEALEEEAVFLGCPSTRVLDLTGRGGDGRDGVGGGQHLTISGDGSRLRAGVGHGAGTGGRLGGHGGVLVLDRVGLRRWGVFPSGDSGGGQRLSSCHRFREGSLGCERWHGWSRGSGRCRRSSNSRRCGHGGRPRLGGWRLFHGAVGSAGREPLGEDGSGGSHRGVSRLRRGPLLPGCGLLAVSLAV